jgi:hypothetical protein
MAFESCRPNIYRPMQEKWRCAASATPAKPGETAMSKKIASNDIRNFLKRVSTAIEFDQVLVDTLPAERFSPAYSDGLWRAWRRDHCAYVDRLASTVDKIPPAMLSELTGIATTYEPALVGKIVVELFALIVGGCCPAEDYGSAELFFGEIIRQLNAQSKGAPRNEGAKASISQWLPVVDPLGIAQDPECAYRLPVESVS